MTFTVAKDVFVASPARPKSRLKVLVIKGLEHLGMHHVLFVAFTLLAAFPVILLASWVQDHAVQEETQIAGEEDLLVARNLSAATSRYVDDLKAAFRLGISTFYSGEQAPGLKDLLDPLEVHYIAVVNGKTGEVERFLPRPAEPRVPRGALQTETLAALRGLLKGDDITISDLRKDPAGDPTFLLVRALPDGRIAFGEVGTQYLFKLIGLQNAAAFGEHKQAIVVDQKGALIAYPPGLSGDSEPDLAKATTQAILPSGAAITRSYAAGAAVEMVMARAPVPDAGWEVRVQQPVAELHAKVSEVRIAATAIALMGLIAASLVSWLVASYIAHPLQSVSRAAGAVGHGDMTVRAPSFSAVVPRELHELSGSFNHMVDVLSRTNVELAAAATRAEAANRAKSEFLANMSHELRTPLNAVLGFSEVMRDAVFGPLGNAHYEGYVRDIHSSATHLIKVITDILDLSNAEAGAVTVEIEPIYVTEIFEATLRLVLPRARENGVAIETKVDPWLVEHPIETDGGKLTQILLNLLSNAVQFTKPNDCIELIARCRDDFVEIAVKDNGIGIAEEDLATVLTPFGQVASAYNARDGFGLGLPLSKKLAERLGGGLRIDSKLGQGTTVRVWLPLSTAAG
jgi:signal transduction histidine kinase